MNKYYFALVFIYDKIRSRGDIMKGVDISLAFNMEVVYDQANF